MKKISDQQNKSENTEPSSPERRTFVKGIAAMGAGVAAFPLLTNTAEAQVPAAAGSGIPSGSSRAKVAFQVPRAFQGDKIDWHGFDRYDFVMDKQTLAIMPFKAPAGEQSGEIGNSDQRTAAVCRRCAQAGSSRQPVVLARRLLESPAPSRSRIAQTRFSHCHTFRSTPSQGH